ncbi:MAG: polymerase sigma factor [Herminiimonas sp.]|nr:polymerase sigma factor [Herminiimonas sp.]
MRPGIVKKTGNHLSDAEIVQRVSAGDKSAFELLMRRYNRPLYRTARSILRDDAEAEDVLQESYLLAYRSLDKFRGESSLSTWLTRIVINEAVARSRKTARRAEIIQLGGEPEWDNDAIGASMSQPMTEQPEHAALRTEVRRLIEKKIDDLPEAFRTVFMLRALEEMTVEETAACLDIPDATVRTRYFRAKGLLRESLSSEIDFAFEDAFSFDGARCDRIVSSVLARLTDLPTSDA